jgi:iron complex transport system permease protein
LLMQTLFRNPLAGPFVLGISSGASLGVALTVMGGAIAGGILGEWLLGRWSLVIASCLGSFLVLLAVVAVATRIKDTMAILIIGLMFGSLTAAVVSVLAYFSPAHQLQQYIYWSFGSLGNNSWEGIGILSICFFIGILLSILAIKPLNALLLGENYAQSIKQNVNFNGNLYFSRVYYRFCRTGSFYWFGRATSDSTFFKNHPSWRVIARRHIGGSYLDDYL